MYPNITLKKVINAQEKEKKNKRQNKRESNYKNNQETLSIVQWQRVHIYQ